ncbi:MAG: EAL domain-containing protein [Myxococcota bacterium]
MGSRTIATASRLTPPAERSISLLFVDDEPHVRRAFARSLNRRGFDVVTAGSGMEAIRLAERRAFPVVVTDLRMPGMDGLTLIERLQAMQPSAAFVVLTGLPDVDLGREHHLDIAISSIVAKPWNDDELEATLRHAMELHASRALAANEQDGNAAEAVLLVEDNAGDAFLAKRFLKDIGAGTRSTTVVDRMSHALAVLHDQRFDVVLVDLSLPDARGIDAVTSLHRAAPDAAIIVLTGVDDPVLANQAIRLGAQDFLIKGSVDRASLARAMEFATERKRAAQRLSYLAHYDPLTGAANRVTLRDRLGHAISRARRARHTFAVVSLDLDHFKQINDDCGHDVGDQVLQEVSRRLQSAVRESDTVARVGGDEFTILLEELASKENAAEVAERILQELASPIPTSEGQVVTTASLGIAFYPTTADSVDELLKHADVALYSAKRRGRNTYHLASSEGRVISHRLKAEHDLRQALENDEFVLHYQPQVAIKDRTLIGFEALLRWQSAQGLVPPAEFIPLLEETGMVRQVGSWVLTEACRRLAECNADRETPLRMAINLSAKQFERDGLVESMQEALERSGAPASLIDLEITETLLMRDTRQTNKTLNALKSLGVRIVIDDFGTGYSSLAFLQRFEVDALKIDDSFVASVVDDSRVAGAVVELGHRLSLEVIAEGVETEAQWNTLAAEGCDLAQGFLIAEPRPRWDRLDVGTAGPFFDLTAPSIPANDT